MHACMYVLSDLCSNYFFILPVTNTVTEVFLIVLLDRTSCSHRYFGFARLISREDCNTRLKVKSLRNHSLRVPLVLSNYKEQCLRFPKIQFIKRVSFKIAKMS